MRYSANPKQMPLELDVTPEQAFGLMEPIFRSDFHDASNTHAPMLDHQSPISNHYALFRDYYRQTLDTALTPHVFNPNAVITNKPDYMRYVLSNIDQYMDDYVRRVRAANRELDDDIAYFAPHALFGHIKNHIDSCSQLQGQRMRGNKPDKDNDVARLQRSAIAILDLLDFR